MISETELGRQIIEISEANLRENHFYLTGFVDRFPKECYGSASEKGGIGKPVRLDVEGLASPVLTDIPVDAKSGKPRRFFRRRGWVREFFAKHNIRPGDQVAIEQVDRYEYRVYPVKGTNKNENSYAIAEFFAGIGLVRLALEPHGFKVVFANDIDPEKREMYEANFGSGEFHLGDIHHLKGKDLPTCDLFTASFPCNDLSIAGAMGGIHKGESSAFWGLTRILKEMGERRPAYLLIENVPGFLMSHSGKDFESALLTLNELGYACDAFFVNASSFTPQSRLRLFVVGKRGVEGSHPFGLKVSSVRPQGLVSFIAAHDNIQWDIRGLPDPPAPTKRLEEVVENLSDDDPAWWDKDRAAYFMNQLSDRHLATAMDMIRGTHYSYGTAFRRVRKGRSMAELRVDGLAGCLRTPRGGSGRQILFKAGKGKYQVRLLIPRECARLQGVPDTYVIHVPLNQALFGFGDAVCVPVIEWIATNYLLPCLQGSLATSR